MSTVRKRTREELISGGYCPTCSRCLAQVRDQRLGWSGMLFMCGGCGFLLLGLELSPDDQPSVRVEVTEDQWNEVKRWYFDRCEEIERQKDEIQSQIDAIDDKFVADMPNAILALLGSPERKESRGLSLVKG